MRPVTEPKAGFWRAASEKIRRAFGPKDVCRAPGLTQPGIDGLAATLSEALSLIQIRKAPMMAFCSHESITGRDWAIARSPVWAALRCSQHFPVETICNRKAEPLAHFLAEIQKIGADLNACEMQRESQFGSGAFKRKALWSNAALHPLLHHLIGYDRNFRFETQTVTELISFLGLDPKAPDFQGATPLILCAIAGDERAAAIWAELCNKGADPFEKVRILRKDDQDLTTSIFAAYDPEQLGLAPCCLAAKLFCSRQREPGAGGAWISGAERFMLSSCCSTQERIGPIRL